MPCRLADTTIAMPKPSPDPSTKAFADAVLDLAVHLGVPTSRRTGEVNITALWEAAGGLDQLGVKETLYKLVARQRAPTMEYIERFSQGLGIDPAFFAEYRLYQARAAFDPDVVGLAQALAAFDEWSSSGEPPRSSRRSSESHRR